ncbi:phage tail tape measure protein [Clostridium cagae]|uniref:phage tail tape measure protein n=1 Tax=Clostridium cagae TaxID=2080751 RepID=UPI003F7782B1
MADTEKLIVELGIKNNNVNKEISNINRELKNLDKEVKSTDKTTKQYGQTNDSLKTKLGNLEKMYTLNSKKLEDYKKKMADTTKAINEQEQKIANMKLAGQDTTKAEEQLARMKQTLSNVGHQAKLTENEIKGLEGTIKQTNVALKDSNISTYQQKLHDLGKSCESSSEKLKSIGEGANNVGNNLLKLSAPIIAFGAYASKVGTDFEYGMAKVQATSNASAEDLEKLKNLAKEMGEETKFSATDAADGLNFLAMAGWKTEQMLNGLPPILNLAIASGSELGTVSDIVSDALTAFSMSAEDAGHFTDIIASASSNANTNVEMLGESFKYVAPLCGSLGYSAEDTSLALGLMANAGIKGSQSGTSLKTMFVNLAKPTDTMAGIMDQYGISLTDANGKMLSMKEVLDMLRDKFGGLSEAEQASAMAALFGKEALAGAMSIVNASATDYNKLTNAIYNCDGETKRMADTMSNTTQGKIDSFKSKLEALGIQVADKLLPHLNDLIDKGIDLINWFSELDEGTQKAIMNFGLFTAASGGVLKVAGGITKGLGSLVGAVGKASTALSKLNTTTKVVKEVEGLATASKVASVGVAGLSSALIPIGATLAVVGAGIYAYNQYHDGMSKSCVTSREELGLLKSTLLELNGVQVQSREELEKSGLVYKELGSDLGETFKKRIEESTKTINDFNYELGLVNVDNVVTQEESNALTLRVDGMVTSALEAIKSKGTETQEELSKMFMVQDGTIDESEQKVLDFVNSTGQKEIEEVNKLKGEINKIYKQAVDDKRGLNEQEINDIKDKTARIQQIELEAIANNQAEQLYAKNQFSERIKKADADTAVELLTERKKAIDTETTDLLANYQTQLDLLQVQKQKAHEQGKADDEANIQAQIDLKTKEKDGIVAKENEKWEEAKQVMNEQQSQMVGKYNEFTGELLSEADIKANQMLEKQKNTYEGLNQITQDGYYVIKNTSTGMMEEIYVNVDENTGKITGCWNKARGEVGGATDTMAQDAQKLGAEYTSNTSLIEKALQDMTNTTVNSKGQIINANGDIVGSFEKVTTATGETITKVKDLNGNPVEIKDNSGKVIENMSNIQKSLKEIPENKEIHVKTFFEKVGDWFNSIGQNATGTNNYQGGLSTVNENGKWELASNNNVRMLGSYNNNPLAYIPNGTGIRTHMQSVSDMKAEIRNQLNSIMLSGGYYNKNSTKAKQLVNNYSNNYSGAEIDYNKLANVMLSVFQQGLSNINFNAYVDVDSNGIANKASKITMDKMNRQSRNKKVVRG